ncbi:interferon gamma related [Hoplias malabaricus]|uniref:interferon gamma related n=1 Tax=Hoplias malabaricus TaxID=27720 RepID=UPI003461F32A
MDSWFRLALICGSLIIESLSRATGYVIPEGRQSSHNMTYEVQTVQRHYDLTSNEWVGRAVFTPYLGKIQTCTCEKLVLAAMLNTYMDIFSDMLKKSKEVEASLKGLQKNVTHLRDSKYSKEQAVLKQLQEIKLINVTNFMIQGGAVNDFESVYRKALDLSKNSNKI